MVGRRRLVKRMMSRFERILVVVKHTPFEAYQQLKLQGKAPRALRWERLRDRHESHRRCVNEVCEMVKEYDEHVRVVSREDLGPQHVEGVDLLIAVGGDGTVLSATHYVDSGLRGRATPGPVVLGVNSDPTKPHERGVGTGGDERRSYGALCYASTNDMAEVLPRVLRGELDHHVELRRRMAVTVRSTLSETRLPPALNDVLVAHPSPAAVSRFRIERRGKADFSFNVWSSGLWVATATGSTAAMASAGGTADVPATSPDLQYMVREQIIAGNENANFVRSLSHGVVDQHHHLQIRWNSQHGCVWIDGPHTSFDLELGDEILITSHAIPLRLFSRPRSSRLYPPLPSLD
ncbi:hypothetical protein CTAYLR_004321 [Chrysophaeum taylorii]|uniref:NAD(+) kinase n=1 Tax=Chrysophaeum taylorii TaxID=2483200 RepID=A0AAD7UHY5_9STRA|nr:hypothetical protein CTAYLR_004321 [Chrysophaeum taylorii]